MYLRMVLVAGAIEIFLFSAGPPAVAYVLLTGVVVPFGRCASGLASPTGEWTREGGVGLRGDSPGPGDGLNTLLLAGTKALAAADMAVGVGTLGTAKCCVGE